MDAEAAEGSITYSEFMEYLAELEDPTERTEFVNSLPKVSEKDLKTGGHHDGNCPICQETFLSVLASEELADAMDSPATAREDLGVTKLPGCSHHFCRKDISKWIVAARKNTCPACRTPIVFPTSSHAEETARRAPRESDVFIAAAREALGQYVNSGPPTANQATGNQPNQRQNQAGNQDRRDAGRPDIYAEFEALVRQEAARHGVATPEDAGAGVGPTHFDPFASLRHPQRDDREEYSSMYS